jgi:hypothetical protein
MTEDNFPRPFYENPLLSVNDFETLDLKPIPGIIQQYEFEEKLFKVAKTRARKQVIYCSYTTEADGTPVEISSFIESQELTPLQKEIQDDLIDQGDLFLNLFMLPDGQP